MTPWSILILLGAVLGPRGVGVMSDRVLGALDPLVPAAIAALGVLVSEAVGVRELVRRRTVARGLDVALVGGGGALLAVLREPAPLSTATLLLQMTALTAMIAAAAWLLLRRSASDIEQRVVTVATVVLLAGTADHLRLSPLFCGYLAGVFWRTVPGPAAELVVRDLTYVRQPLVALVLVVTGARVELSPAIGAAAGGMALLFAIGSWMWKPSGSLVDRAVEVPTGVIAVASALTLVRVDPVAFSPLLGLAALGWLATDLLSLSMRRRRQEALA
jgi:hypothetical protein